ncbi:MULTISPECIES: FAD/NAD(P)-binding protein [Oenococcus]|uniref:Nitrogen regulatory protein P-II n=1 Tax=Oenococcus kitaharae DSM 17330 TaxID=1045004 RepID=G9WEZ7_9LACO|nr:FAD/NAD(P)-binding protein [Oenococcus kitaharae]EHN58557.1 Nitrogen regulatory protein P-II [Oenococcus kitaharae DSM 17330]OEY84728.1 oxidoreductase [Oenococcus kitaharae]OEY85011.1 oxidoreductase [Oenococcus kitaharae]OEY85802.1 oxidoreductase [Oenococcus kitaharae]
MKIAIIGAGPRGLAVADRLVVRAAKEQIKIDIKLFDPYEIGGRVWDPSIKANNILLMNTVVSQVSFFADDSIYHPGPTRQGPNFYHWIKEDAVEFLKNTPQGIRYLDKLNLNENSYAVRGLAGLYQQWFFNDIKEQLENNSSLVYQKTEIKKIAKHNDQYRLSFANSFEDFDFIFMGLGFGNNRLTDEEKSFSEFAKRYNLRYIAPGHPAEIDLSQIPGKQNVIIRGLGLSFFDYLALLTEGRGGHFVEDKSQELRYHPSGKEPTIYAGSRSGNLLHARALNQKSESEQYAAQFFTTANLKKLEDENGHITYSDFFSLFDKELQFKHYENLTKAIAYRNLFHKKTHRFLERLRNSESKDFEVIAHNFQIPEEQIWHWNEIIDAIHQVKSKDDLTTWYERYLANDIEDASEGNKNAIFASAFDILRDIRETIRDLINQDRFQTQDLKKFLTIFNHISTVISVGPPLIRIKQLKALLKANIVHLLGPDLKVENNPRENSYIAKTALSERVSASSFIDARLPQVSVSLSEQDLRKELINLGWFHETSYHDKQGHLILDAAQINPNTFQLIDEFGQILPNLYSAGIPHESISWFTTVLPRRGVNTIIFHEAAIISEEIIQTIKKTSK